jgi:acetyl esterase/lipase
MHPIVLGAHAGEDRSVVFGPLPTDLQDGRAYHRNITIPTLTPYLPEPAKATGTGVIVVPGGGMHFLSVDNEGAWVAQRLAEAGVAAFVLRYRIQPTPVDHEEFVAMVVPAISNRQHLSDVGTAYRPSVAEDGAAAILLVRERADDWHVDPDRVGMLGFSAGGFVTAATALDAPVEARPDFLGGIYPALWGDAVVPRPVPPMFLAWATDDEGSDLIIASALRLYDAWRLAGGTVEAHAYASGGHGFGMAPRGTASDRWFGDFMAWLRCSGYLSSGVREEAGASSTVIGTPPHPMPRR